MASNLFKLPENNRKDITQQFALSNLSNWCQRRGRSQFECCAEMANDNKSYVGYVERSLDKIWHKMASNLFKLPENNQKDITQQFALSNLSNWCQGRGRSQFECRAEMPNANKSYVERSLDQIWHKMALNIFKLPESNRKDITQQFALSNLSNWCQGHSGCLDSKNILSTIDAPPGVPGVSKNQIFFFTNENVFLLR